MMIVGFRWLPLGMLLAMILLSGCATQVRITSQPSGARVYIDQDLAGYTPLELKLSAGVRQVRLVADGYQPRDLVLRRQFDSTSLLLVWCPPVWFFPAVTTRLRPEHHAELQTSAAQPSTNQSVSP